MENSIGIDPNVNHEIQELLSSRHPDRYWNGFLVPKEYNAFLWKKHKVSQYFKDRTIGKLVPLSCEMQLSFFIEVIFLHKSWNLIFCVVILKLQIFKKLPKIYEYRLKYSQDPHKHQICRAIDVSMGLAFISGHSLIFFQKNFQLLSFANLFLVSFSI